MLHIGTEIISTDIYNKILKKISLTEKHDLKNKFSL